VTRRSRRVRLIEAARWVLVLPAAVGAYAGVLLLLVAFKYLEVFDIPSQLVESCMKLLSVTGGTYYFIAAGAHTAPRRKIATATLLVV
jgi:hypothetical protein